MNIKSVHHSLSDGDTVTVLHIHDSTVWRHHINKHSWMSCILTKQTEWCLSLQLTSCIMH